MNFRLQQEPLLAQLKQLSLNKEKHLILLLFFLSAVGIWKCKIMPSAPNNLDSGKYAMCSAASASQANVQSKAHVGIVNTPVGSSTAGLKLWSATATWEGNTKPTINDDVLIPANSVVVLDENINVKSLRVEGKLIIDLTKDLAINAQYILVTGVNAYFEWGTATEPYNKTGVITLLGSDASVKIPGTTIESKAILVERGAVLEFHGKRKTSWTSLNANAAVGTKTITVADANHNWSVGDELLLAPSRLNWNEGEKRTITAISADKKTITLNSGLAYPHIGTIKTYTRGTDNKKWTGDMRAEVGMLSKSIKIQGDASSEMEGFGGHIMIHLDAKALVENVELYRMGQKSILARYPFHWHLLAEKGQGQYFKNNSVHHSFNRGITIHGTESTLVENNFFYDHIGHGVFLEDGSERFNTIRGNVVLLTKRPAAGEQLIPSDNEANEVQNRTPSSYWITNPNNIFENNVAAGTQGTGFWFAMPKTPMALSAVIPRFQNIQPYKEPLGKFYGNKAHSCVSGFDIFDQLTASHALVRNGAWERTDIRLMENCTWYANNLAVYGGIGGGRAYTENVIFKNNVFMDNMTAVMHANYSMIDQSVFVANSGENVFSGERQLNRGYDGSCTIRDCHLVDWQASNANYVQNTGGSNKHVNYRVSGITKDFEGAPRMSFPDYSKPPKGEVGANTSQHPRFWSYIHWDKDGSLTGKANTSIITNHPLGRDGSEVRYENWTNIYRTDRRFAYYTMTFPNGEEVKSTVVRTKAGTPKVGMYYLNGFYGPNTQYPVIVNDDFLYTIQFESVPAAKNFTVRMQDDYVAGDQVLVRYKDFGKIAGIEVVGKTKHASLAALKASNASGFAIDGDYLYLKMVSIASTPDISFNVKWTGSITLPILDTDGDGISDYQESINGTDPIPNDPIPVNPPIKLVKETVSVDIVTPLEDTTVVEGYQLVIRAEASSNLGTIEKVSLYLDDVLVREEKGAPYEWGHPTSPNPNEVNNLLAGQHSIRVEAVSVSGIKSFDEITLTVLEKKAPYTGTAIAIPGTIEAENYDKGGSGISYLDSDTINRGGVYRDDFVDIGVINSGYIIGWTATDEWLEYTLNVTATGNYDLEFIAASLNGGGIISLFIDGKVLKSAFDVPKTGSWTTYSSTTERVNLTKGKRVLRVYITKGGFNLDKIVATSVVTANEELIATEQLSVFPNPSTDGHFRLSASKAWEVYTARGEKIAEGMGDQIDISTQVTGVYFIKIEQEFHKLMIR